MMDDDDDDGEFGAEDGMNVEGKRKNPASVPLYP
jgi:hypothetical protein